MKKVAVIILMVGACTMAMAMLFPTDGHAAWAFYACTVKQTGPGGTNTYVLLECTSPAFNKYFTLSATRAKELMAVALTAMASGKQVWAFLDKDLPAPTCTISYMYLKD